MRIVIDLQGAQNESRFRGIGRYSLALAKAIARNAGNHEILVVLNGCFGDTIEPLRAELDGLVLQGNIRVWHTAGPLDVARPANMPRRAIAALVREDFIARMRPDIVHITSLFDGLGDNTVCTIPSGKQRPPTTVSFYDAIPLIYPDQYLRPNPSFEVFYREQMAHLRQADMLLAISDSSAEEAERHVGIPPDRIRSISSAADEIFAPGKVAPAEELGLRTKYGIHKRFLMYSSGADERKNHVRLIEAFSELPTSLRSAYALVFVGGMPAERAAHFRAHAAGCGLNSDDFVITGHVKDSELVGLYRLCTLFVFPSIAEGFGLPALEAMSCGTPTIASNTTSLPEVMGRSEAMFDPLDANALTQCISECLSNPQLLAKLGREGLDQAQHFSWDRTAIRALNAMEELHSQRQKVSPPPPADPLQEITEVVRTAGPLLSTDDLILISRSLASNRKIDPCGGPQQLLIDVSEVWARDGKSGVQRVVHGILKSLFAAPPTGFSIEPVYATPDRTGFRYARRFVREHYAASAIRAENSGLPVADDVVETQPGDIFLGLDLHHAIIQQPEFFDGLQRDGVRTLFVVYDLLPIHVPQYFLSSLEPLHLQWLRQISRADGIICISNDVAQHLLNWLEVERPRRLRPLSVGWWHLGFEGSALGVDTPLSGIDSQLLSNIRGDNIFLTVGTVEPRKGHAQLLDAFEYLWKKNVETTLVIVGKCGWSVQALAERLQQHPERGQRLFWLENADDTVLNALYARATCLIAPSFAEGFGLPLVEAASHGIPIIARDIPVFREVASTNAFYFRGETAEALGTAVLEWTELKRKHLVPSPTGVSRSSWPQSTERLTSVCVEGAWQYAWKPRARLFFHIPPVVQEQEPVDGEDWQRVLLREMFSDPPDTISVCPIWFDGTHYRHAVRFVARVFRDLKSSAAEPVVEFEDGDTILMPSTGMGILIEGEQALDQIKSAGTKIWFLINDLPRQDGTSEAWFKNVTRFAEGFVCASDAIAHAVSQSLDRLVEFKQNRPLVRSFHSFDEANNSVQSAAHRSTRQLLEALGLLSALGPQSNSRPATVAAHS